MVRTRADSLRRVAGIAAVMVVTSLPSCAPADVEPGRADPPDPLSSQIEYRFVRARASLRDGGWLLARVDPIQGDLEGEVRWWFEEPNPVPDLATDGGSFAYYEAKWEVRMEGAAVLSGRSAGKVVTRSGEDGVWDGHGVVTGASPAYGAWLGRSTYETGPVVFGETASDPPWGRGLFVVR